MSDISTMRVEANAETSIVGLGQVLVAAVLYYTPVTILSLAGVDWPRLVMMILYLLPFAVVPLGGLLIGASRHSHTSRTRKDRARSGYGFSPAR